ncbi:NAD-dependent epimerase/dehydratase [uncultured virus]|nr:NAD-dependent epimerase/dehydratase [uncultured virus]
MNKRTVLVTGGCGFVGRNLIRFLRAYTSDYIIAIDNLSSSSANEKDCEAHNIIYDDITNLINYPNLKPNIIFHLAGYARIQPSFQEPLDAIYTNTYGTSVVCELARKLKAKIIYTTTSSSKHGDYISPYTLSKRMGEEVLKMYHNCYDLPSISVRLHNVYGPGEPSTGEFATVIAKFTRQYRNKEPLTVVGDGSQSRDFTHVEDICHGLVLLSYNITGCQTLDLGREQPFTIMEVVNMFHPNAQEGRDYIIVPRRINEGNHTAADMSAYKKVIADVSHLHYGGPHSLPEYITSIVR